MIWMVCSDWQPASAGKPGSPSSQLPSAGPVRNPVLGDPEGARYDDLITGAADALLLFVADATAAGPARRIGAELHKAASSALAKIRYRLSGSDRAQVEVAVRGALIDGDISQEELADLIRAYESDEEIDGAGTGSIVISQLNAKNSFVGRIDIENFQA
jgi:hypothetical protein